MTSSEPAGARLVADGTGWVLILDRTLAQPIAAVWAALTEVEQLAGWGPFRPDRDLTSPGTVRLTMLGIDEPPVLKGKISGNSAASPDLQSGWGRAQVGADRGGRRYPPRASPSLHGP